MTESDREKLDKIWRGEKCIICNFAFDQIGFSEIEETGSGWVHKDCLGTESLEFTKAQKDEAYGESQFEAERGN